MQHLSEVVTCQSFGIKYSVLNGLFEEVNGEVVFKLCSQFEIEENSFFLSVRVFLVFAYNMFHLLFSPE